MNEAPSMATQRTHHSETDRRTAILVTGAGGEMGHGLIQSLARTEENPAIVAFDLRELPESLGRY